MKKAITKTDGQLSHIAKGLLKHEISEANQNPAAYAEAMGWDNVVKIMMQNNMKIMPTIDIMEHGKINDFLTNFIAKKLKK